MTMEATRKGMESQTLYLLSSKLSDAADIEAVIRIAVESMSRLLQVNVGGIYVEKPDDHVYTNGDICLDNGKHMVYKNRRRCFRKYL